MADDDIDFDAYMRDRGVPRGQPGATGERPLPAAGAGEAALRAEIEALARALKGARILREQAKAALEGTQRERDEARAALTSARAGQDEARAALASALAERDEARAALASAQAERGSLRAERDALLKERKALQRQVAATPAEPAPPPTPPTVRQALVERGVDDEGEAAAVLLELLEHDPGALLDGLAVVPALARRGLDRLALVCERAECQPEGTQAVVIRVTPERCEVCGGSDIKVAFEGLLRASRIAGVTRLVIVGGSPSYRTQLKELSRGTDLKLDLVSGDSKLGKRRARTSAERVVIWGATEIDHGTSAAYEGLGDRLIHVRHRGISRMLRVVAEALT